MGWFWWGLGKSDRGTRVTEEPVEYVITAWCGDTRLITVGCGSTGQTGKRQKVVVLRELQRAMIYTTR